MQGARSERRVNRLDVLRKDYVTRVNSELDRLLGDCKDDPTARFGQHNAAARNVYKVMSPGEKGDVAELVEKYKKQANKPEVQQK